MMGCKEALAPPPTPQHAPPTLPTGPKLTRAANGLLFEGSIEAGLQQVDVVGAGQRDPRAARPAHMHALQ